MRSIDCDLAARLRSKKCCHLERSRGEFYEPRRSPATAGLRLARSCLTVPIKRSPRKTPLPKTCFANGLKRATCESRKIPRFSAKNARCLAPLSMRAAVLCLKMTAFFDSKRERDLASCWCRAAQRAASQMLLILAPFRPDPDDVNLHEPTKGTHLWIT